MNATHMPLYRVLRELGIEDQKAEDAARYSLEELATKQDLLSTEARLLTQISDSERSLMKWGIGALFAGLSLQATFFVWVVSNMLKP